MTIRSEVTKGTKVAFDVEIKNANIISEKKPKENMIYKLFKGDSLPEFSD